MPRHIACRTYSLKSMIPTAPETQLWNLDPQSLQAVALTAHSRATRESAKLVLEKKYQADSVPVYQTA